MNNQPMRKSQISSLISPHHCLWIMAFALSIILIAELSRSSQNLSSLPKMPFTSTRGSLPSLAYWMSGTKGDTKRIMRLLKATYHPRNRYLLQLDSGASDRERAELALLVESEEVFREFGNVEVVGKSFAVNEMGSSFLAAVLHAAAVLLKIGDDWDWFVTLSASDYPLMTQDDLLHALTSLPRNLNFIHYNRTRWKERQIANRIVIDPSLYSEKSSPIMYAVETRENPDDFAVFGGSPWSILSRDFMDYCVKGWDNFPRKLLMYLTNMAYPIESYFHTILCNSQEFQNATLDNDLRYMIWDSTIEDHQFLTMSHLDQIRTMQGAAFARPFQTNDLVLDEIDRRLLNRPLNGLVPGEWCPGTGRKGGERSLVGSELNDDDEQFVLCSNSGDNVDVVKPGLRGENLKLLLVRLVQEKGFGSFHCTKN